MNEIFSNPVAVWFLIGLGLLLLELVLPGLIVIFFGFGAWVTALIYSLFHFELNAQILCFLISSLVLLLILRKYLKTRFFGENKDNPASLEDEFIGKTAVVIDDFKAGHQGKIEFKGTQWSALCDVDVKKGDSVEIVEKESIKLIVKLK